jgi:hypothetical protein
MVVDVSNVGHVVAHLVIDAFVFVIAIKQVVPRRANFGLDFLFAFAEQGLEHIFMLWFRFRCRWSLVTAG